MNDANTLSADAHSNSIGMTFVRIEPGEFMMGASTDEPEILRGVEKQHRVRLTKPFMLGATEVTQGQWKAVMRTLPWTGQDMEARGDDYPATRITWSHAVEFCRTLSNTEGQQYRLPTEAEWEYACRAGSTTAFCFGNDLETLSEYAWIRDNTNEKPGLVRRKKPNTWGLYDMHGNVWEWCSDWYAEDSSQLALDPQGPLEGSERIIRGGGFFSAIVADHRSAMRRAERPGSSHPEIGFRVVLNQNLVVVQDHDKISAPVAAPAKDQPAATASGAQPRDIRTVVLSAKSTLTADDAVHEIPGWGSSWSADGKQLVRQHSSELQIIDLHTGENRSLGVKGSDAAWSPRPRGLIAFIHGSADATELSVVRPDGSGLRRVAPDLSGLFLPSWSGDGKTLYFFHGGSKSLHSVDVDIDAEPRVACESPWPAVSPNEAYVAYQEGEELVVKTMDEVVMVRHVLPRLAGRPWRGLLSSWSPDNRLLGFGSFGSGEGLWLLELSTRSVWKVADDGLTAPRWSPDGTKVSVDDRGKPDNRVLVFEAANFEAPPVQVKR